MLLPQVAFEKDTEPYAKERDAKICQLCSDLSVDVISARGHTLFDLDELRAMFPGGKAPASYGSFVAKVSTLKTAAPIPAPTAADPTPFPSMPKALLSDASLDVPPSLKSLGGPYDPPGGPHPADAAHSPLPRRRDGGVGHHGGLCGSEEAGGDL